MLTTLDISSYHLFVLENKMGWLQRHKPPTELPIKLVHPWTLSLLILSDKLEKSRQIRTDHNRHKVPPSNSHYLRLPKNRIWGKEY